MKKSTENFYKLTVRNMALFFLASLAISAQAATVCSMTLNSPDELEVIKKQLGTKDYTYVELDSKPENFCGKPDVKCDILVVSAHFGGHFFGASTPTKAASDVPLESLEALSCSNKCGNIFQSVKQVYLFGCNTLNGKIADDRTPEQYVSVLRGDNYGLLQAQSLAANIYSPLGGAYRTRMEYLFPNASQIFGFSFRAPVGKQIRSELNKTFSKFPKDTYIDTLQPNSTAAANWGELITTELKSRQMIVTQGKSQSDSLTCKILNQPQEYEKIKLMRQVFEAGDGMKIIMSLVSNLKVVSMDQLDSRSISELNLLKKNKAARVEILDFIQNSSDAFVSVRLNILEMMAKIEWVSAKEASDIANVIVLRTIPKIFKDPVYIASIDSAKQLTKLDFKAFPDEYWEKAEMFSVVERFNAIDSFVVQKAVDTIKTTQDPKLAKAAGESILRIEKWANIGSQVQSAAKLLMNFQQPELQKLKLDLEATQNRQNTN